MEMYKRNLNSKVYHITIVFKCPVFLPFPIHNSNP